MSKAELWEVLGGLVFMAGLWVTVCGIALLLVSVAMQGLGVPGK